MKKIIVIFIAALLSSCAHNDFLNSVETVGRTVIAIPADMAQAAWAAFINRIRKGDEGIPKWREEMPDCNECNALNADPELDQEKFFYVCDQCARGIRDESPDLAQHMSTYEVEASVGGSATLSPVALIQAVPDTDFFPSDDEGSWQQNDGIETEDVNAKAQRLGLSLSLEKLEDDFYQLPDFSQEDGKGEQKLQPLKKPETKQEKIWSLREKLQTKLGLKK